MAITFTLTERIAAPVDAVFAALLDVDSFGRWMPGFVRLERTGSGPLAVGHRFRETRKLFGREATEEFEVTALEPGRALALFVDGTKGSSKRGEYRFRYEFAPEEGGTRMTVHAEIGGMGRVMEWIGRLFAGGMKKAIAKDHAAFKAWVESSR